ncbi:hypothetical protein AKJ16_DCAP17092 [Drosera capensis]
MIPLIKATTQQGSEVGDDWGTPAAASADGLNQRGDEPRSDTMRNGTKSTKAAAQDWWLMSTKATIQVHKGVEDATC